MRFMMKFASDLWRECTSCAVFFKRSLMVSMIYLLRSIILSWKGMSLFFMFTLNPVTSCMPPAKRELKSFCEIYPLLANNLPYSLQASSSENLTEDCAGWNMTDWRERGHRKGASSATPCASIRNGRQRPTGTGRTTSPTWTCWTARSIASFSTGIRRMTGNSWLRSWMSFTSWNTNTCQPTK